MDAAVKNDHAYAQNQVKSLNDHIEALKNQEQSAKEVQKIFRDQLKAAGKYSSEQNRVAASFLRSFYVTQASIEGISPLEYYQKHPYKIVLEGNQAVETTKPTAERGALTGQEETRKTAQTEEMYWPETDEARYVFSEFLGDLETGETKTVTESEDGDLIARGSSYMRWFRDVSKKHKGLSSKEARQIINKYLDGNKPLTARQAAIFNDITSAAMKDPRGHQYAKEMAAFEELEDYFSGKSKTFNQAAITLANEALRRDAEAFAKKVNTVEAAGKAPQDPVIMLKQTPLVLKMIGRDVLSGKEAGNNGIFVSPHTFRNILNGTHTLTFAQMKQIPEAMADPIMIFDSASQKNQGDVVFMLEVTDDNGATVVVPVALRAKDQNRAEIDIVKSAYAKEDGGIPNNDWFKREAGKRTRYVNEEKLERWKDATGVQFPVGSLRNAHGNTIHTEADLVKLKSENPEFYQSAKNGQGGIDTNSAAFKTWFGDSKIVDENGEPLEVHHGTGAIIEAFDPSFTGKGNDQMGSGFYFTDLKETAGTYETYTNIRNEDKPGGTDNPNTVTAYLSIKNPIVLSVEEDTLQKVKVTQKQAAEIMLKSPDVFDAEKSPLVDWVDNGGKRFTKRDVLNIAENYEDSFVSLENDFFRGDATAFREAVHAVMGYDGVIKTFPSGEKHFVAWFPTQIKSVNNRGTFDPNDPNIFYQSMAAHPDAVGGITPEIAEQIGIRPGALTLGEEALSHIEEKHGKQIRELGYADAREFVNYVLSHVDAVYQGENRRIVEFVTMDTRPQSRVLTRLEFELSGDKYEVKTAGPIRPDNYKNRTPLWERAQSNLAQPEESVTVSTSDKANPQQNELPGASTEITSGDTGQSGEQLDLTTAVQKVNQDKRGGFNPEKLTTILYKEADFSTFVHETSHFFLDTYARMASDPNASQKIKDDMNTICRSKRVGCSGQK